MQTLFQTIRSYFKLKKSKIAEGENISLFIVS